jgi:hypothetical protein
LIASTPCRKAVELEEHAFSTFVYATDADAPQDSLAGHHAAQRGSAIRGLDAGRLDPRIQNCSLDRGPTKVRELVIWILTEGNHPDADD